MLNRANDIAKVREDDFYLPREPLMINRLVDDGYFEQIILYSKDDQLSLHLEYGVFQTIIEEEEEIQVPDFIGSLIIGRSDWNEEDFNNAIRSIPEDFMQVKINKLLSQVN